MGRFDPPQPPPDPSLDEIRRALSTLVAQMEALSIPVPEIPAPQVSVSPTPVNVEVPTQGLVDAVSRAVADAIAALPAPETPQISLEGVTADVDLLPLVEAAQDQRAVLEALQEKLSNLTAGSRSHFDGRIRHAGRPVEENNPLPVRVTELDTTAFGEIIVTQRTPIFSLSSLDPISILRDVTTETASGTVTTNNRELELAAPGSGDSAVLESAQRGRYEPGYVGEGGIGIRLDSRSAGATIKAGVYDGTDGFFFRADDDGLSAVIEDGGTEIYSSVIDIADRTSDVDAWLQNGKVLQIRYVWYGYGVIEWGVVDDVPNHTAFAAEQSRFNVLHRARVDGQTSVAQPNLPIYASASDGATLHVGGRQYSIYGKPGIAERKFGDFRTAQSVARDNAFKPLIAIRRRSDEDWVKGVRLITDSFDVITNANLVTQLFVGASVTGGSWVAVQNSSGESAVEVNRSATGLSLTNAVALDPSLASSAGNNRNARTAVFSTSPIPREQVLLLAARSVTTSGTAATVTSSLSWQEIR